ncbi:hypothetical protein CRE_05753 [Caenorhabditis remanei]|uniref:Serpentine Receptor, class H n=1 Tax=Caenorhabditis remanei TaxID=31234 RepID=E3LZX4_CAERE|nr:hypothetical protein CRE_05753 [Caenorhabditis remanei]
MNTSFLSTPDFIAGVVHILTFIELPINLLAAYCIVFKTPKPMKCVKWEILNLHFWSMFMDINLSILTRPLVLIPALAMYPQGELKTLGVSSVVQVYLTVTMFAGHCQYEHSFLNRESILFTVRKTNLVALFSLSAIILELLGCVFFFFPAVSRVPDQDEAFASLLENFPNIAISIDSESIFIFSLDLYYIFFILVKGRALSESFSGPGRAFYGPARHLTSMIFLSVFLTGFFTVSQINIFCFLLCVNMRKLSRQKILSPKTYKLKKKFLITIVIQIFTPLIVMFGPATYLDLCLAFNYYNQVTNNICIILISLHGWVSAIVLFFIHEPYRKFCKNLFCYRSFRKNMVLASFRSR